MSTSTSPALDALKPFIQRFIGTYLNDPDVKNATEALRKVQPHLRRPDIAASKLMAREDVQAALAEQREKQARRRSEEHELLCAKAGIDHLRVLAELGTIAFSDINDIIDFSGETPRIRKSCEIPERARRAIAAIKIHQEKGPDERGVKSHIVEFKFWPKEAALQMLGRHFAMFTDKLAGADGGPLNIVVKEFTYRDPSP